MLIEPLTIETLYQDEEVQDLLATSLDFDLSRRSELVDRLDIEPLGTWEVIAGDAAGGLFLCYRNIGWILYVSSEGQAGLLATNLTELVQLITTLPFWQDTLKFSGGGNVALMRRVLPLVERENFKWGEKCRQAGKLIARKLGLKTPVDPIGNLHQALTVLGAKVSIRDKSGVEFGTLFGPYTIDETGRRIRP